MREMRKFWGCPCVPNHGAGLVHDRSVTGTTDARLAPRRIPRRAPAAPPARSGKGTRGFVPDQLFELHLGAAGDLKADRAAVWRGQLIAAANRPHSASGACRPSAWPPNTDTVTQRPTSS